MTERAALAIAYPSITTSPITQMILAVNAQISSGLTLTPGAGAKVSPIIRFSIPSMAGMTLSMAGSGEYRTTSGHTVSALGISLVTVPLLFSNKPLLHSRFRTVCVVVLFHEKASAASFTNSEG